MVMTWAYLAGFFDGEGSVRFAPGKSNNFQLSIHQSECNSGQIILDEIAAFLRQWGVRCKVSAKQPYKTRRGMVGMFRLYMNNRAGGIIMIQHMLPYLRVKRVIAQDILRYFIIFPVLHRNGVEKRSHCKNGHVYTPNTIHLRKDGSRECAICCTARANRYYREVVKPKRIAGTPDILTKRCNTDAEVAPWL